MTPQQIKAMKQALEAMESVTVECNNFHHPKKDQNHHWAKCPPVARWDKAITAIKEALAQEQEPVAIKRMKEWIEYLKRKSDFGQHMKIPSEMSAGTCWELAIELEQFINTTPPQRTWVGLTDEQRSQLVTLHHGWNEYGQAIEASLKQQNGYAEEKNT